MGEVVDGGPAVGVAALGVDAPGSEESAGGPPVVQVWPVD